MSTSSYESLLRACFGSILATVTGATVASCGSSPPSDCGGCGCSGVDAQSQSYDVTYTVCGSADADAEASSDGGALPDAGACFYTCAEACAILKPSSFGGTGVCVSSNIDVGAGQMATAMCATGYACLGRKVEGLETPRQGDWLARAAWLEAASVHAFVRLARELEAHGAPAELVARAKASARDEARHARIMRKLARKHGSRVPRVIPTDMPVRGLESIARENAVEGCVGETLGALLAAHRALSDSDPEMREAMAAIAPDELRHAALGWAVAEWVHANLADDARARVRAARDEAARSMLEAAASETERALAAALMQELWAA